MRTYCKGQETLLSALWWPKWEGNPKKRGCMYTYMYICFPGGTSGKEPAWQCRRQRCGFDPWLGKISWMKAWQPSPVFLPGGSHGRGTWWATVHGSAKCRTQLSNWTELIIYFIYSSVYMSITNFQFIPPLFRPSNCKIVFYTCKSIPVL